MNLLVSGKKQVIDKDNWMEKINSSIYDTGNALDEEGILKFSRTIDMEGLKAYRVAVGKQTREIVKALRYKDLKRKVSRDGLKRVLKLGAVVNDEAASWLIDYWGKKMWQESCEINLGGYNYEEKGNIIKDFNYSIFCINYSHSICK